MKRSLVDVNALLALLVRQHVHHAEARRWFGSLDPGEVDVCRVIHLALIRLLCNQSIMGGNVLSAPDALGVVQELLTDERFELVAEPSGIDALLPGLLVHPAPAGKLVTDAYLAAFAIASSRRLVTFDKGFRQFRGLDLNLLS